MIVCKHDCKKSIEMHEARNEYETAHDKTYNKTCMTSKDTGQPVHIPSMARVLVYPSLDSPEAHAISEDSDQTARTRRMI